MGLTSRFLTEKRRNFEVLCRLKNLNVVSIRDSYPLLRMDEFIDFLLNSQVFSTLDENSGNWYIEVDPSALRKQQSLLTMSYTNFLVCHSV